jgi:hypothetical protein
MVNLTGFISYFRESVTNPLEPSTTRGISSDATTLVFRHLRQHVRQPASIDEVGRPDHSQMRQRARRDATRSVDHAQP